MDLVTLALAKSYMNKRIGEEGIVTGATPQQAAQIEQNKTDITNLQTEVDELKEAGGNGSGENQNYILPIGGDELGGVKNGGNVIINADGTMTAPDNALSDEQVRTALDGYIADNPGALAAGATPEQVEQIEANKTNLEFATATDAALFATLETGSLYEVSLDGWAWGDGKLLLYSEDTNYWGNFSVRAGHRYSTYGCIHLRKGDVLITNADTVATSGKSVGCLLQKMTAYISNYDSGVLILQGRGEFDGLYRTYTATENDEYIRIAYQYDVDYAVHFYVAKARSDAEVIPYTYLSGFIKADTGEVTEVAGTWFASGYNTEVVSQLITIRAPGKFLLVKNAKFPTGKGEYCWAKYTGDGAFSYGMRKNRWGTTRNYFIVPLFEETEYIRLNYVMSQNPYHLTEALLVDAEYLFRNGYADHMAGKSLTMFGDSYVAGHNIGAYRTWHYMFAEQHQMKYTNLGTNGIGLVKSPNLGNIGLIDKVDTLVDADYIGVICGRNDYSTQAPIGTNDDVSTPDVPVLQRTFKGGLNYLCQYLVENFPGRKVFFLTPWFFPSRTDIEETHKPQEYIDAILEITGLWGIPCFDAARRSGIHCRSEAFRSQYFLSADDVSHLNDTGAKLMLDNITGWMLAL